MRSSTIHLHSSSSLCFWPHPASPCCWLATFLGWLRVKFKHKLKLNSTQLAAAAWTWTWTRIAIAGSGSKSGVGRPASLLLARHTRRYQFLGQLTDDWPCGLPKSEPEALERLDCNLPLPLSLSSQSTLLPLPLLLFVSSSVAPPLATRHPGKSPCNRTTPSSPKWETTLLALNSGTQAATRRMSNILKNNIIWYIT